MESLSAGSGVLYYLIELSQWLADKYAVDYKYTGIDEDERYLYTTKYKSRYIGQHQAERFKLFNESMFYDKSVVVFCNFLTYTTILHKYNHCKPKCKFMILVSDITNAFNISMWCKANILLNKNIFYFFDRTILLYDKSYPVCTISQLQSMFRDTVYIRRCVYPKYWKFEECDSRSNTWFVYKKVNSIYNFVDYNELDDATLYLNKRGVCTTSDSSLNPATQYAGFVYCRTHDYMPRLPVEFWLHDKPVLVWNSSSGMDRILEDSGLCYDGKPLLLKHTDVDLSNYTRPNIPQDLFVKLEDI